MNKARQTVSCWPRGHLTFDCIRGSLSQHNITAGGNVTTRDPIGYAPANKFNG